MNYRQRYSKEHVSFHLSFQFPMDNARPKCIFQLNNLAQFSASAATSQLVNWSRIRLYRENILYLYNILSDSQSIIIYTVLQWVYDCLQMREIQNNQFFSISSEERKRKEQNERWLNSHIVNWINWIPRTYFAQTKLLLLYFTINIWIITSFYRILIICISRWKWNTHTQPSTFEMWLDAFGQYHQPINVCIWSKHMYLIKKKY